jgi:hypothetical protein
MWKTVSFVLEFFESFLHVTTKVRWNPSGHGLLGRMSCQRPIARVSESHERCLLDFS